MVLYAVFTERMKTGERLGVLVTLQTNLAHEELVMYLLSELCAGR